MDLNYGIMFLKNNREISYSLFQKKLKSKLLEIEKENDYI